MYSSMMKTVYKDFIEINKLQTDIMVFVDIWVRTEKTPVPQQAIIKDMVANGINDFTVVNALNSLLRKGYIRRAIYMKGVTTKTYYVQLRRV